MAKWGWAFLFGITMALCFLLFAVSPAMGWWLPEGVSTHSPDVDRLYYIILYITAFFFVVTEGLLVYFMVRFGGRTEGEEKPPPPKMETQVVNAIKKVIPTEHRLELAWTIVPALILLYIAFAQVGTWSDIKYYSSQPTVAATDDNPAAFQIGVSARQFEWRMRYPSPDMWKKMKKDAKLANRWYKNPQMDDVHVVNELHVWTNSKKEKAWWNGTAGVKEFPPFVVHLSTIDVQHNFNLPHFRVKQDALPGKVIPVWFRPNKSNGSYLDTSSWKYRKYADGKPVIWEIPCAELCGRWHYHMIGRVHVHPNEEDFLAWLEDAAKRNNQTTRN